MPHSQTQVLNTQDQRFGGAASDPAPVVPVTDGEMKLVLLAPRQHFSRFFPHSGGAIPRAIAIQLLYKLGERQGTKVAWL